MALILKENNCNVIFCGNETMERIVAKHNIKYIVLKSLSFALGFERYYKTDNSFGFLDNLYLRVSNKLFNDRKTEIKSILDETRPHAIIIDQFLSSDYIVIHSLNEQIKVFFLQTMMPTIKSDSHPPLYSPMIVGNWLDKYLVNLLWIYRSIFFDFWRIISKFKYLGYDDYSILLRQIKDQKDQIVLEKHFLFNYVFKNVPELIMSPMELEFKAIKRREYHYYLGSLFENRAKINPNIEPDDETIYERIEKEKLKRKIIFCSLGTRFNEFSSDVSRLMNILIRIAECNDYFIIAVAGDLINRFDKFNNDRIIFIKRIDQFRILKLTDLFITHGGLNSIKEAIETCTPMIILPIEKHSDQPGNAARASFHKLGLKANIKTITSDYVKYLMEEIFKDELFKDRLSNFKRSTQKYTKEEFLLIIERLIES